MKYAIEENTTKPSFSIFEDNTLIPSGFKELTKQEYKDLMGAKSADIHGTYDGTNWIAETPGDKSTREAAKELAKADYYADFDAKILASYNRLVTNGDIV